MSELLMVISIDPIVLLQMKSMPETNELAFHFHMSFFLILCTVSSVLIISKM